MPATLKTASRIGRLAFTQIYNDRLLSGILHRTLYALARTVENVYLADDECCLSAKSRKTSIYNTIIPGSGLWIDLHWSRFHAD